jgi:hypothetical protein
MASREKAALALETAPPFLREERFFVLEDPFADPPEVLREVRFLVAMRLSLAQKRKGQRGALYVVPPVL